MSEAPERIWITGDASTGSWNSIKANFKGPAETEYVRADRIEELEAMVAKVMEALQSMSEAVVHTTLDDGPQWPEDRMGVWLAALHACKNVVQSKVDRILAELKGQDDEWFTANDKSQ